MLAAGLPCPDRQEAPASSPTTSPATPASGFRSSAPTSGVAPTIPRATRASTSSITLSTDHAQAVPREA